MWRRIWPNDLLIELPLAIGLPNGTPIDLI